MIAGHCNAQTLSDYNKLPDDWRSKTWQVSFISNSKPQVENMQKNYKIIFSVSELKVFKLYHGSSLFILAFGPFDDKDAAFSFFDKTKLSTPGFPDEFNPIKIRKGEELDDWFEIAEDGSLILD